MFEPFQKFVMRAAGQYGVRNEVTAARICQSFREIMGDIFECEEVNDFIEAGHFKSGVFVVNVENMAWAQEVITRKEKIIREMNNRLGDEVVKNIRAQRK